ncbi:MAG: hypothetical protein GF383_02415 [Candidatus Lokiarchaeota archaeon]|nr:hypothetical protein [Candidatus Lokiarchaeota archaeon]MBD3338266.1 hypothetical protein [Candidatus Lokiarchaeota archaeon]
MLYQETFIKSSNELRELTLFVEWVFIFICFELGMILMLKFIKIRKKTNYIQELAYSILIFSYGGQWIWFLIADFYTPVSNRHDVLNVGYFFLILGAFIFIVLIEKDTQVSKIKYLFSAIYLITLCIYMIAFFTERYLTQTLSDYFWYIFLLFYMLYFKNLAKRYTATRRSKKSLYIGIIALFLLFFGYTMTSDFLTQSYGFGFRVFGDILQLIGWIILYYFFLSVPRFSEFEWERNVNSVFLMTKSGLNIFSKILRPDNNMPNTSLISGAIAAISMMLDCLTDFEGMSVIKKPEKITIIYSGKFVTGVIFCKDDLTSLRTLLQQFVVRTEQIYEPFLDGWLGNFSVFEPIENIYREIFIEQCK